MPNDDQIEVIRQLIAEFEKLADTPLTDPIRGLQISRMHFADSAVTARRDEQFVSHLAKQ